MARPQFPRVSASDDFRVDVGIALTGSNPSETIEQIERWIVGTWTPENRVWTREWRAGPRSDDRIVQVQELRFFDTFVHAPEAKLPSAKTLVIRFHVRERQWWRDWLVKLLNDLKEEFSEVGDVLFCKYQD